MRNIKICIPRQISSG